MRLDDSVIGHVAKLIQLAILTGTDIVDHLRMIDLNADDNNSLNLEKSYDESFEENLQKMVNEINDKKEVISNMKNEETIFS